MRRDDYDAEAAKMLRRASDEAMAGLHEHYYRVFDLSGPMPNDLCAYDYLEAYRAAQGAYERVMGWK